MHNVQLLEHVSGYGFAKREGSILVNQTDIAFWLRIYLFVSNNVQLFKQCVLTLSMLKSSFTLINRSIYHTKLFGNLA